MSMSFPRPFARLFAAAALAAAATAASAGPVPAPTASVTLTGWAYGGAGLVKASTPVGAYGGYAGAFAGSLAGTVFDTASFVTYCIELEEQFSFSSQAMTGYRLVEGASYFQARHHDAGIADQIGRLMTYADAHVPQAGAASWSTSLQLAIWNLVYDGDASLAAGGSFADASGSAAAGGTLLAGGAAVATSRYDIYALEKAGSQDFLVAVARPTVVAAAADVPEPGSLALAAAALGGLALLRRRAGA